MKRLVVVSAGLSDPSSTTLLAELLADAATQAVEARGEAVEVEHVELRGLAHALTDHLLTGFPTAELAAAIELVRAADGVIAVTPTFSASYSGLFKTFFDVLEVGLLDAKPVLAAATGGSARHSLMIDHAMRPLLAYLRAVVVPTGVFAATEDFAGAELRTRVERAAGELADLVTGTRAATPKRTTVEEELSDVTPFETLLRRASGQ